MQRWLEETMREQPYNAVAAVGTSGSGEQVMAGETSQAEYYDPTDRRSTS